MNIFINTIISLIDKLTSEHPFYKNLQLIKNRLITEVDEFEIQSSTTCYYPSKNLLDTYRKRFEMLKEKKNYTQMGFEESIEMLTSLPNTKISVTSFTTANFSFGLWLDEKNIIHAFTCVDKEKDKNT